MVKTRYHIVALCCVSVVFVGLVIPLRADDAVKAKYPGIYDESASGVKQVADAIVVAKREHKRILLQFGANWCSWCLKLHKLFETDQFVREELKADYVVALIDVNNAHNNDLIVKYGAETGYGLPFLVVLDSDGNHLTTKNSDDFEEGGHLDPQKVLAFLKLPLMTNTATLHSPIENSSAIRDKSSSRQIAMTLLEMQHQWATNNYQAMGMEVPSFLAKQGEVSSYSAGRFGAFVQYDFQNSGIEWTRRFHIWRADTNTATWVLYEIAAPKDTNLFQLGWKRELIKVRTEP